MTNERPLASMGRLHLDILQRGDHLELQLTGASKQGKFVRARAAITQGEAQLITAMLREIRRGDEPAPARAPAARKPNL